MIEDARTAPRSGANGGRCGNGDSRLERSVASSGEPMGSTERRASPATVPGTASSEGTIAQLKELGELKASGVLTQEEFDAQKAKILAAS